MGISAEIALAAANSYTEETVIGGGAIKGKNCTISSITEITGGHRVTFQWTLDDGTVKTGTMDVMDGQGGGGSSDYTDLENKPSINSVTLSGNKTTSDLGISYNDLENKPTIPSTSDCYKTTDSAGTGLDDADSIPYYNASAPGKSNTTWSIIKSTLKTYFDTIYSTITAITGLSDVNVSSPSDGQVLKYDQTSGKWKNANESGGGGGGINYSTTEQDTGLKWIDGKTIYQKTFTGTTPASSSNNTSLFVANDIFYQEIGASIDNCISINGFLTLASGRQLHLREGTKAKEWFVGWATNNTHSTTPNTIRLAVGAETTYQSRPYSVTVQYTKV